MKIDERHGLPSCVGREPELASLLKWHREAERGAPQLAALLGPTGIGKSRLLEALRHKVRLSGGVVLEARCEGTQALQVFARITEQAIRFLAEVGAGYSVQGTSLGCTEGCHALWFQHGDSAAPADPERLARSRDAFCESVLNLLRAVSAVSPPVVLLHDLERADRASLELLRFLLDAGAPAGGGVDAGLGALFAVEIRTDERRQAPAHLETLLGHRCARSLPLQSLDEAGVRALLQAPSTVAQILARTGGSPAAIRRMLEAPPPTQAERVERVRAELPDASAVALDLLSVAGRPVRVAQLQRALSTPLSARELELLSECALVRTSIADGEAQLGFASDAERQHVYRALDPQVRARHHAAWCATFADVEVRARHALAAGDTALASELGLRAARTLASRHAPHEAAALLENVAAAQGDEVSPSLRAELVALYRITGDYRRGLLHAKALRDAHPERPSTQRTVGDLLMRAGRIEEASKALKEAHRLARKEGDADQANEVETLIAELFYRHGDHGSAARWAEGALRAARDARLAIVARNTLGKVALARGDRTAAAEAFTENQRAAAAADLPELESQAWANLGFAQLSPDAPAEARPCFERALELAERAQDTRRRAVATEALAVNAHFERDYARAREHYQAALTLMQRLGTPSMVAGAAANLGELYLSLGDVSRAEAMCALASQVGGAELTPQLRAEGLLLRGHVASARRDNAAARAAFEAARDLFTDKDDPRAADVTLELASLALEDGDLAQARKHMTALPSGGSHAQRARIALLAARLERASAGEPLAGAERAVALAEQSDDDELRVQALPLLARALAEHGRPCAGREVLDRAWQAERRLRACVPEDLREAWDERPAHRALLNASRELVSRRGHERDALPPPPPSASADDAQCRRWASRYPKIVGAAPALREVFRVIDRAADSDMQVLIRGESGTGKELVAEALHQGSARKDKPFVRVNCAALVETLLLSELFGHERGAFTGASSRRKGRFEVADGGTLFLDEIGDISPRTQAALLRVLQEGEFERVGGTHTIKVNVRIIAATHRDLEAMVQAGSFREDLYYRLRGVTIQMPALRDRLQDLPALTSHLLERVAQERGERAPVASREALALMAAHSWPGNVRELENVLRSASLFCDGPELGASHLRPLVPTAGPATPGAAAAEEPSAPRSSSGDPLEPVYDQIRGGESSLFEMKKRLERECIERALQETGGNITRAASLLGMKRPRLSQLVKQYELATSGRSS